MIKAISRKPYDYCTGLLLPEGRKSMEPMAARLAPARTRTMHKEVAPLV